MDFTTLTAPLIQAMQSLAIPAGVIGILFALLSIVLVPLVPSLAAQKGYIQTALLALAFMGFVPALVSGVVALGGGGGAFTHAPAMMGLLVLPRSIAARVVRGIRTRFGRRGQHVARF